MRVLVTGATGFIGHYVINELINRNYIVIASSAAKEKAAKAPWFDKVNYIPFNLENFKETINYYSFFNEPDFMIHLAWEGLPNYKATFHEEVNLPRHISLLKNIISNGLPDLTVTGTCFEYGLQEGCLPEDLPVHPANSYAKAKNSLRLWLEEFRNDHFFSFKWIRLFYMYGKGQNTNSLLSQLDKALSVGAGVFNMSGGQQIRDYLPVEKVAENIVKIASQKQVEGIINNCSGVPSTVENFVKEYLKKNDKHIALHLGYYPYPDYEPMKFWGDVSKLKKVLKNE